MSETSPQNILWSRGFRASCHRAWIEVEVRNSATVMDVGGEIDAATVHFLDGNLRHFLDAQTPLVVTASSLRYFSVGSVRALLDFNLDARRAGLHWALVTGDGLRRPLQVVDRCATLPVVESAAAAFARVTTLHSSASRSPADGEWPALRAVR